MRTLNCRTASIRPIATKSPAYLENPGWSTWTRSTYWSHFHGYYLWAYDADELTCNPMVGLIRPPAGECVPDPVTDDELALALQRSPDQPWRLAIMLAAYAGLRGGEIARIRREDVTEAHVRVRKGKGGRDALIETAPILWEFIRDRPLGPLVRSITGRAMSGHRLVAHQASHWRRIGLPTSICTGSATGTARPSWPPATTPEPSRS